jgi:hypothetical protein
MAKEHQEEQAEHMEGLFDLDNLPSDEGDKEVNEDTIANDFEDAKGEGKPDKEKSAEEEIADEDGEPVDITEYDRDELKAVIKDKGLDIDIEGMDEDEIREAIIENAEADEDGDSEKEDKKEKASKESEPTAALKAMMDRITSGETGGKTEAPDVTALIAAALKKAGVDPEGKPLKKAAEYETQDFLKDVDFDALTQDPKAMNKLLNQVAQNAAKGAQPAEQINQDELVQNIGNRVQNHVLMVQAVSEFYRVNKDLEAYKPLMGIITKDVQAANPKMGMAEVLAETEKQARIMLNIKKAKSSTPPKDGKKNKKTSKKPAFMSTPKSGRSRQKKGKTSKLANEVQDTFNFPHN